MKQQRPTNTKGNTLKRLIAGYALSMLNGLPLSPVCLLFHHLWSPQLNTRLPLSHVFVDFLHESHFIQTSTLAQRKVSHVGAASHWHSAPFCLIHLVLTISIAFTNTTKTTWRLLPRLLHFSGSIMPWIHRWQCRLSPVDRRVSTWKHSCPTLVGAARDYSQMLPSRPCKTRWNPNPTKMGIFSYQSLEAALLVRTTCF
jgi:hypothetical protein